MIRSIIKGTTSIISAGAGDIIGDIADNYIGKYCGEKCDESDSIIGKAVFGSVWLAASTVGLAGHAISAAADAIGDAVADSTAS